MNATFDDLINTQIENSNIRELKDNITNIKKIHNIEDNKNINEEEIEEDDEEELNEEDIIIMKQNLYCYLNYVEEIKQKKDIITEFKC